MAEINPDTWASDPIRVRLSTKKLSRHFPELVADKDSKDARRIERVMGEAPEKLLDDIEDILLNCDSRAAVVTSESPLRVAAYSDEFDGVVLLHFPQSLRTALRLEKGSRLVTINQYYYDDSGELPISKDLIIGENSLDNSHRMINIRPLIADFLTDDMQAVNDRKAAIEESEWQRCQELADHYETKLHFWSRNGHPLFSEDWHGQEYICYWPEDHPRAQAEGYISDNTYVLLMYAAIYGLVLYLALGMGYSDMKIWIKPGGIAVGLLLAFESLNWGLTWLASD